MRSGNFDAVEFSLAPAHASRFPPESWIARYTAMMPVIVSVRPELRSHPPQRCWHVRYQFCSLSAAPLSQAVCPKMNVYDRRIAVNIAKLPELLMRLKD